MVEQSAPEGEASGGKGRFWGRLRQGLAKTRGQLSGGVGNLLLGKKEVDDQVLEELETALLITDVGVETTEAIMESLAGRVKRKQLNDTEALHASLGDELKAKLDVVQGSFEVGEARPFVVLFVGVNGVGKTTTIGKLAKQLQAQGKSVLLAAGDTFRAAAVEQLSAWGARNEVPVIAQAQGSDSASVIFDAVQAAKARDIDVVLADTAGRLQAKTGLMDELKKIRRVVARLDENAPHEVVLVLDAGVGQNALSQVQEFDAAVGLTGLIVSKLDGTAKGGVLFALAARSPLPVYFVGVGEQIDDLRAFDASEFVDALLSQDESRDG